LGSDTFQHTKVLDRAPVKNSVQTFSHLTSARIRAGKTYKYHHGRDPPRPPRARRKHERDGVLAADRALATGGALVTGTRNSHRAHGYRRHAWRGRSISFPCRSMCVRLNVLKLAVGRHDAGAQLHHRRTVAVSSNGKHDERNNYSITVPISRLSTNSALSSASSTTPKSPTISTAWASWTSAERGRAGGALPRPHVDGLTPDRRRELCLDPDCGLPRARAQAGSELALADRARMSIQLRHMTAKSCWCLLAHERGGETEVRDGLDRYGADLSS
jgi:hypothetical protein